MSAKLTSKDIEPEVRRVLEKAREWEGVRCYMTAYQILDELPDDIAADLIAHYGLGGKGAGRPHSAITIVSNAAAMIDDRTTWIDTASVTFTVKKQAVKPGAPITRVYRLPHKRIPPNAPRRSPRCH